MWQSDLLDRMSKMERGMDPLKRALNFIRVHYMHTEVLENKK